MHVVSGLIIPYYYRLPLFFCDKNMYLYFE